MLLVNSPSESATQRLQAVTSTKPQRIVIGPPLVRPLLRSCAKVEYVPGRVNVSYSTTSCFDSVGIIAACSFPTSQRHFKLLDRTHQEHRKRERAYSTNQICGSMLGHGPWPPDRWHPAHLAHSPAEVSEHSSSIPSPSYASTQALTSNRDRASNHPEGTKIRSIGGERLEKGLPIFCRNVLRKSKSK